MTDLQPTASAEKLQEYYQWREREMEANRLRAQTEGDDPPILTADDEAALDRAWATLRQEELSEAQPLAA